MPDPDQPAPAPPELPPELPQPGLAIRNWRTLGQLHALVGWRFFVAIALRAVPIVALELAALLLIRLFFVRVYVEAGGEVPAAAGLSTQGVADPDWPAAAVGAGLIAFLVLRLAIGYAITRNIFDVVLRQQQRLTTRLFANYLGQPYRLQRDSSRSEQRQTLFIGTTSFVHSFLFPIVQLFVDATVAVAVFVLLVVKEPAATVALMVWMALCFAVQALATARASRRVGEERWYSLNRMRMIVDAALGDPRLTKLSASEDDFVGHFRDQADIHGRAVAKEAALAQVPVFARELVLASSVCLLVATLLLQERGPLALVGAIALFAAASVRLLPALQRSVTLVQKLNTHSEDLHRIHADREIAVEPLTPTPGGSGPLIRQSLRLRGACFRYPLAKTPLLEQVDLTIRPGERLLITGPSGAGKSTLILILCGLIPPDAGSVDIDGTAGSILERIRDARVALVPQDPFIANLSIIENIALPAPPESIDRERAAALMRRFRLGHAPGAPAGEHGGRLSGGERQRLALIRAIQQRPELLILDEATSQLDAATEEAAYRCIAEECPGATILAIAHRPPPAGIFDRHVVLENGRLTVQQDRAVIGHGA